MPSNHLFFSPSVLSRDRQNPKKANSTNRRPVKVTIHATGDVTCTCTRPKAVTATAGIEATNNSL